MAAAGEIAAILTLSGAVRLTDMDGTDRTPRLAKARAILLCLALSPGGRMERPALRRMLWEGRPSEQQSASLRQALSALRTAMGPLRDLLDGASGWVRLDLNRVELRGRDAGDMLAADLDPHEPSFRAWLALRRGPVQPASISGSSATTGHGADPCAVLLDTGEDAVLRLLGETAYERAAQLVPLRRAGLVEAPDLLLELRDASGMVAARLIDAEGATLGSAALAIGGSPTALEQGAARLAAMVASAPALGLADVLSHDPTRLDAADARLAGLGDMPAALSLRAFIRNTRLMERVAGPDTLAEAREMSLRAMEAAPESGPTAAIAALLALRAGRGGSAQVLMRQARLLDPAGALVRRVEAAVSLASGDDTRAHRAAHAARRLGLGHLSPASWTIMCAGAAAARGNLHEARDWAEAAHDMAPSYRPPLRFLAVLESALGRLQAAEEAMAALRRLEPDVTPGLIRSPDYPVGTLRRAGLLDALPSSSGPSLKNSRRFTLC